ncbi:MAG TPA: hypothetical protein VF310_04840 [Vicinamibacteria bacterium]
MVDTEGTYVGTLLRETQEQGRVAPISVDEVQPVDVSQDLGVSDPTTV